MSIKKESDVKVKVEYDAFGVKLERKDPTSFLPDEPMSYEIKQKKKKKKKRKPEDPFKDIAEKSDMTVVPSLEMELDPEVNIKVENIEVELDFNDFADNGSLMVEAAQSEDSQEQPVKIEKSNHEAVLLTFESVVNDGVLGYGQGKETSHTHVCKVCHLVFQSPKTLRMHQRRKHKAFRKHFQHICDYCGMSYEQKNSLVAHMKRKHGPSATPDDQEERTCDVCALVFKGMTRLRMHMRRKHGSFEESFKFECTECGLTYDKHRSLIVHVQRKHTRKKKPVAEQWYNCPFCPKIFTKRETYARHVQRKHKVEDEESGERTAQVDLQSRKDEETGEITCTECPLVFSSVNFLKLHMRRKHNALKEDFRLKCRICNLSYDKIESLKRHVRRKHDRGSHCEVCGRQFDTREAYLNHSHVRTVKECPVCGLIFASQGRLAKHLRCTHKLDTPKTVFCSVCNEGFHDKRQLKPHLMKVHWKVSYTCRFCEKVFKAKESYRRHVLFKHPAAGVADGQLQACDECSAAFPDEFELCRHVRAAHKREGDVKREEADAREAFQCTKCPETFAEWEPLRLHFERSHLAAAQAQCQVCGELLPGAELQRHLRAAHERRLQCAYCPFRGASRASLTQHVLRHRGARTLRCEVADCRYQTYHAPAMEKHRRRHAELGARPQCSRCPFRSMNKYVLRYHEAAHSTGRPRYACAHCDYRTSLPANLVQHRYKHADEKRFKCEVCPFATKYNTSLRFHVKKKHCDLPTDG